LQDLHQVCLIQVHCWPHACHPDLCRLQVCAYTVLLYQHQQCLLQLLPAELLLVLLRAILAAGCCK
jgi:hypothetical protein